jgi:hypothetical protein
VFRVTTGEYEVSCHGEGVPALLSDYQHRAALSEDFDFAKGKGGEVCFVGVGRPLQWPFLVVVQRYAPSGFGFNPGVLVVAESHRLFLGAGRRLLGYDLSNPARLWEDETDVGFWSWSQHGQVVLMAAELELAAWDLGGCKLWSRFVEPPWQFSVRGQVIELDVMGIVTGVNLHTGQEAAPDPTPDRGNR